MTYRGKKIPLALFPANRAIDQKEVERMRDYEIMFIVRPDVDEEGLKASREKVQSIIAEHDGSLTDEQDMGKRRFAYTIVQKQGNEPVKYNEGYYTVYNFKANTDVVAELNRVLNIDDRVLRHIVINLDEEK